MLPMYYKNAAAAIIVMNVTEPQSFEGAKSWAQELQEKCSTSGLVKVLAVNKCDLPNKTMLESGDIKAYAESNGLLYYEVVEGTYLPCSLGIFTSCDSFLIAPSLTPRYSYFYPAPSIRYLPKLVLTSRLCLKK